jgi:hypothetical protein
MAIEQIRRKRVVCDVCGRKGPITLESEDPRLLAHDQGWGICEEGDFCHIRCALSAMQKIKNETRKEPTR